ncbi:MAG: polysaccharide biosynthesis protein [Clostridia bacterium]|nr:polysaccharide biosynthesis protein [Clostridia bacterium]
MSHQKQIKFGALLSYLSIALNIAAGLIYTPWMLSQIGESDYGLYTLANSIITLFLVDFGLSTATARFVSKYIAEGKQAEADNFLGVVYKLYLIIDAVIFAILLGFFFFIDSVYVNLTPLELEKFKVVYAIAGFYAVVNFPFVNLNGILTANERFIQQKFADIINRVLTVGLTIVALLLGMGLYALVAVHALAGLITIAYKLYSIRKHTATRANFRHRGRALYRSIFAFSLWTTVTMLAQRLIFNITPSILGIVSGTAAIAVFGIVTTIEQYSYLITGAIKGMFMPRIARIYTKDEAQKNVMPLMIGVGRFQFALASLIAVGFAVVGEGFLTLWLKNQNAFSAEQIHNAYLGILLTIVPGVFYNSLQIANTALIVQNKVKLEAIITAVTGGFNLVCSFFLSTYFGVLGACISICIAYFIRAILFHFVHHRVMKFDIPRFIKECYLKMSVPIVLSLGFGCFANALLPQISWITLALKTLALCLLYGICVWCFALSRAERETAKHYVRKKLHR